MPKDFSMMEDSNPFSGPTLDQLSQPSRRQVLAGGAAVAASALLAPVAAQAAPVGAAAGTETGLLGFEGVGVSTADTVVVPRGYVAQAIAPWGDPVGLPGLLPPFLEDAGNTAAEQEAQLGMHHDGLHYFPLDGSRRGLLALNHEYVDHGLLFADGDQTWSAAKVRKSQAAHGVSVIEVTQSPAGWALVRPSRYARRITANSPTAVSGPAAGHRLLQTAADPRGRRVRGTLNNCAAGITPWGSYLSCEENFIDYFSGGASPTAHERRWGMQPSGSGYRWHEHDPRFDATRHPNEPNRFGWVVEIDPFNPRSLPVKRTAMGRAAREGATVAVTREGRAVVYSGEDARFEYIYKFVSRDRIEPGGFRNNATLLDHGTLFVARFAADGTGRWLPLRHGQGPLTSANGFADQGEVLVKTRQASDLLEATRMDRPEWIAVDAARGEVYVSLTNNTARGTPGQPGPDAANPRAGNAMGHILRWREDGDFDGTAFRWEHFVLAGEPGVSGDAFGCPDGLWVDGRGVLWIQTDMAPASLGRGDFARLGNNAMLAADPASGEIRRFMTGPVGCELTGVTMTPDGRTLFVNVQHPGEGASYVADPSEPSKLSRWPGGGRPRSATVAIRRLDGGLIGI